MKDALSLSERDPSLDDILHAVATTLPEPIFVLDEEGEYITVIGGAYRAKYDDPSGLVGKRLHDVMDASMADWVIDWIRRALTEGATLTHEYAFGSDDVDNPGRGTGPSGKQWFEASVVPLGLRRNGRQMVAWIAYNATERHDMLVRLQAQRGQLETQKIELERLAMTDQLTGLPNRRYFMSLFEHEFGKVRNGRADELSLIVLDLDHFKRVNDTWGHAAGDAVLHAVGERIGASVRKSDVVARIGGEEFAILLPDTGLKSAQAVADKIVATLNASPITLDDGIVHCTASMGVAAYQDDNRDPSALMRQADQAMYRAKEEGRNRWCQYV